MSLKELDEAIEILKNRNCPEDDELFKGYAKAIQLGIEALEQKVAARKTWEMYGINEPARFRLPSEGEK